MKREDVERLTAELERQDEYAPLGHIGWEAAAALRALVAERDAAYAAGQAEMRERAAELFDCACMDGQGDEIRGHADAIHALPIKPRP